MDSLTITLPYANIDSFIPTLIFLGFGVGVVSAFLGIGGAWLVTPALNILGFPMTYAVGTDIAHMGGKGALGTFYHARRNNVDFPMAFFMLIGTVVGIEAGAQTVMYLEKIHKVESILRWVYIILLSLITLLMFIHRKQGEVKWAKTLHLLLPRPLFFFKTSNIRCSIWLPILIGLVTGYAAGFLGIGGGLLRLPALIYLGASMGTKIGVLAACRVQNQKIKTQFGLAVLGCLISVICKQMNYPLLSKCAILAILIFLVVSILTMFFRTRSAKQERA